MGTCCAAHLAAKIRDYASNAENGAVTVNVIENSFGSTVQYHGICGHIIGRQTVTTGDDSSSETQSVEGPVFCANIAEFTVSYYPKKES